MPSRHLLSFLIIIITYLLCALHQLLPLLAFLFLLLPHKHKEPEHSTKEESFSWGTPSSLFLGIALIVSGFFPFLILRTSFSPHLDPFWLFSVGFLLPIPLGYLIPTSRYLERLSLLIPLLPFFLLAPFIVYLNQEGRPFLYETTTIVSLGALMSLSFVFSVKRSSRFSWMGFGVGLLLCSFASSQLGYWLSLCFFLIVLFSNHRSTKLISAFSMGMVLFGTLSNRGPGADVYLQSLFRSRDNSTLTFEQSVWSASGNFSYAIENDAPTYFDDDTPSRIEVEGSTILLNDRRAGAERYAGLILRNLHSSPQKMMIFGDTTANSLIHIQKSLPEQLFLSTPIPKFTQFVARNNPTRNEILIAPEIQLFPFHPQELLQEKNVDLILDIIHSPFPNAINHPNTSSRVRSIKASLTEDGIYAQLIHLRDFPSFMPQQQAKLVAQNFTNVQLWLPPQGADSLLIVARDTPFEWNTLSENLNDSSFDILEISALAIGNKDSIAQWSTTTPKDIRYPLQPVTHLATLEEYIPTPQKIWPDPPSGLEERLEIKKRFLGILRKAGEGQVNEVFQEAAALFQGNTDPGMTLAPLIAPHLKDAQKEIKIARIEGQTSPHWDEAQKYAMTASMLAPKNAIPQGLLGEIAIGKGLPALARTHFQAILTLDPKNIIALNGMARISGLEEKTDEVEHWLNESVAQTAQNWRSHHNLGRFYQQQGKLDFAEKSLKKARSLAPKDSIETRLVLCELYLDQGEATRALLEIERVIKINPTAQAWFLRGRAYFDLESWTEAEDDFRRATLTDPQFHDARGAIGYVKIARGDLEGAAQAFRTTLRFSPDNEAAQQNLKLVEKELAKRPIPPN